MLVHPAVAKLIHQGTVRWITAAKDNWNDALRAKPTDPDRKDAIAEFKEAYDELAKTEQNLPPFDEIIEKLPRALRNTIVIEFNTRGSPKTPEINWRQAEAWILVGGLRPRPRFYGGFLIGYVYAKGCWGRECRYYSAARSLPWV
jgi:hypothetical protein